MSGELIQPIGGTSVKPPLVISYINFSIEIVDIIVTITFFNECLYQINIILIQNYYFL